MSESSNLPLIEEPTSDDRLWALLAYLLTPLVPLIIFFMDDKKNRSFIKAHHIQALALGIVLVIFNTIMSFIPVVNCVAPILTLGVVVYYAVKAHRGELITIPVITDFVKSQGWA